MKKRVFAMLMACVMALSLVACGSKSDSGDAGNNGGDSGVETIKLGGVGPLTGGMPTMDCPCSTVRSWPWMRSTPQAA